MKSDDVFLRHILDEIDFLIRETSGVSFGEFMKNELLKRGCARSLEIIGEAVKNLSNDFLRSHREIEWKKLAGLRDKIIHHYFGVNWDIVWDVVTSKLPDLRGKVERILEAR
jgi:uncharacterized protein with HEPN domain